MPKFIYTAKNQPRQVTQGEIEAESTQDAINKLLKMGYFTLSVQPEVLVSEKQDFLSLRRVSNRDIVMFTRQLSSLIESGVNILTGLNIIAGQTPNKYLRSILNDINAKIKDGKSLSSSLATHSDLFSGLYVAMIHSGEIGGNLEQVLKRLADFLEKEEEFKNSVRAALTYPAFVFAVSALTILILLGFVIPRLVNMFEDMGQTLPLPTRILVGLSGFLRGWGWTLILAVCLAIFFWQRLRNNLQGKLWLDRARLKTPLLGTIVLKTEISRLMRTLSLLLSSGIAIITSLDIASSIVENQILKSEAQKFKERISGGLSFSQCLNESKLFPVFVANIVTVGEESGTLERALLRIADDYERDVDRTLKTLTQLLEPTIILVMGVIVGFIVLSMLLPIFQISVK
ncbi:MAG: type II secretion system F family protein [Candidatus Omnitrophica bacterium]|nr:type II secretion system F family protein [Candidatus Omnitrophota bacterium]